MEYVEQLERYSGFTVLSFPVFDSVVFALDNYARLELLVRLHDVLPAFLLNPVFTLICLLVGIVLLDKSNKQRTKRMSQAAALVGVEQYRQQRNTRNLIWPFLIMCFIVCLITVSLALGYSLTYKGTAPLELHLSGPRAKLICKASECSPKSVSTKLRAISVKQTGTNNINQIGDNNRAEIKTIPTVQSIVVSATTICDLREGEPAPDPTGGAFLYNGEPLAALSGDGGTVALVAVSPYKTKSIGNNRFSVTDTFALSSSSEVLGRPVSDLAGAKNISLTMMALGLSWCSTAHGLDVHVFINGNIAWGHKYESGFTLTPGQSPTLVSSPMEKWADGIRAVMRP